MAKTILTDIDLQQNEVQNAVLENRATAPSSPKPGQQYFDTTDNTVKTYNGTEWTSGGGGGGGTTITVDTALSTTSTNPVQNKVVTNAINGKQATLVSGTNIKTINGNSLLGSGNITISGGGGGGGLENLATGVNSLSILGRATTSGDSTSVGSYANAGGDNSTALGAYATASEEDSISLGYTASTSGVSSTALGAYATASWDGSTALGATANAGGGSSTALGAYATASGEFSTALGSRVQVYDDGVASIGANYIYDEFLTTQLYVIAKGSPLSEQYLGGKAGLAYAVINEWAEVQEGKIISFETLFANGVNFSPSSSN